ncbi:MAG: hypothetical protein GY698_14235 [Actinomycetia bacterium]|nr:hypothetical protein [Actinomycetes bacterium]
MSLVAAVALLSTPSAAYAHEYQTGGGSWCFSWQQASVSSYTYGDANVYSTWGREDWIYNHPYWADFYLFGIAEGHSYTNASAADAENYVVQVGADCVTG